MHRSTRTGRLPAAACLLLAGLLAGLSAGCSPEPDDEPAAPAAPLFVPLPPEHTNVTFSNTLSPGPGINRNVLMYEYFHNGAGVAVGDVDGDGLDDLYFSGNMSYNRLYLNRGGMVFEDVTDAAGVGGRRNTWKTGTAMADVDGDGLLDLYVCYSGQLPDDRRIDELYINQGPDDAGIPRFEERAASYGLANPHASNSALFFDYDRDGDLDLLLVNHNVEALPVLSVTRTRSLVQEDDPVHGVRLYRNDGGSFRDATKEAGISSSPLTYGLGAGVSDVDRDGWPDVYISNDYSPPDYLYLNNGDGTFTDRLAEGMGHTSFASMGVDIADMNNDAWPDVFVADMLPEDNRRQKLLEIPDDPGQFAMNVRLGFHRQYMRNTLQLNNGNGTFSEIGQLAGISNTDWSWAPLAADYDNDGWKDLFVTNGIPADITNLDFIAYKTRYIRSRNGRLTPDDVMHLLARLPSADLPNYIFRNDGGLSFDDVRGEWGMERPLTSNGAAYADLDDDGDLDLITNNLNAPASIFENRARERHGRHYLKLRLAGTGKNTHGIGARVTLHAGGQTQFLEQMPTRGYLSSVSPVLHFGLGARESVDSLHVEWGDGTRQVLYGVAADQTLVVEQRDASGGDGPPQPERPLFESAAAPFDFRHRMEGEIDDFARQPLMVHPKSFTGPALAGADANGDGRQDVFVGGGPGQSSRLYLQGPDGGFRAAPQPAFDADRRSDDVDAAFVDVDADGDLDLYVASGGYGAFGHVDPGLQDRLYVNDGHGHFTARREALPLMHSSTGAVASADIDGDGFTDLFVGGHVVPGRYPLPPRSYVLINDGQGRFEDRTSELAPELEHVGMVSAAAWRDLDGDGADELIVAGAWMPIAVFGNVGGALTNRTGDFFDRPYHGLWNALLVEDLNGDGYPDLLAGNLGLNTQLRAGEEEPAELIYGDFDNDGSIDPVLSSYVQGTRYPRASLDAMADQLAFMRFRFPTYESYAEATIEDVFQERELENAATLRADHLETTLFLNEGGRRLERSELPREAQISPVFAVQALDVDDDGDRDLLLAGNMHEADIRSGNYDASYGILLRGDGEGRFRYVPQRASGFRLRGDVRSLMHVNGWLLAGVNRAPVQAYRPHRP